jgi:anti-sigma factor RsiW
MLPTCREATLLLDTVDDPQVPVLARWSTRFHLRYCDKCRRFAAQYRATAEALRALATPPSDSGIDTFRAWRARG